MPKQPAASKSTLNPWEALLASATRTRPPQDSSTSSHITSSSDAILGGGYTILLQHSMTPKSQRKWALESTIASVDNSSNTSSSASLSSQFASSLSIQQQHQSRKQTSSSSSTSARRARGDWYGISGPFLVRQAFHDLSKKCNGRVVLVSVAGTSGIWDLDHDNDDDGYYHQQSSKDDDDKNIVDMIKLFRRNGACVDLNSNPFGWNDELKTEQESKNNNDTFSTKATLNNLQSIATAIRQAASRIQSNEQQSQQPIPIIFDSLTPLLHLHGAQRIAILLKSLGRTSSLLDNNNNNNNNNNEEDYAATEGDTPSNYNANRAAARAARHAMPEAYRMADASAYSSMHFDDGLDDDYDDDDDYDFDTPPFTFGGNSTSQSTSTVKSFLTAGCTFSFGSVAQCGLVGGLAQILWSVVRNIDAAGFFLQRRFSNSSAMRRMDISINNSGGGNGGGGGLPTSARQWKQTLAYWWRRLDVAIRGFVRSHSDLALSHVAAYYKTYQRAANDVVALIETSGVESIIHDDITTQMCSALGHVVSGIWINRDCIWSIVGYPSQHLCN